MVGFKLRIGVLGGLIAIGSLAACSGDDPPDPPPGGKDKANILSFTAMPTMVAPGATVTLAWAVEKSTGIVITGPAGEVTMSTNLTGSVTSPAIRETTNFTLTANGEGGNATRMVTVTVDPNAVTIVSFEANPDPAPLGGESVLSWRTVGANRLEIRSGANMVFESTNAAEIAEGSVQVDIRDPSNSFTLIAANDQNTAMETKVVRGVEEAEILDFRVRPQVFTGAMGTVSVNWSTTGGETITLTGNGTAVSGFNGAATGTISVTVTDNTRFELTVSNAVGTVRATQVVGRAIAESEPNNDIASANMITGGATGEIAAGQMPPDVDYYSFQVPAGGNVYLETTDGMGGCNFDTVITLFNPAGMEVVTNDDGGVGACSLLDPANESRLVDLPAGTYVVRVAGFLDRAGAYTLLLLVGQAACGNGYVEATTNEVCDDGNTMAGDGCDASCRVEIRGTLNGPGQEQTFTGMLASGTAVYQVDMASAGYIRAEVFAPAAPNCMGADTVLALTDDQGDVLTDDDNSGVANCSLIDPRFDDGAAVEAGRYFIRLSGTNVGAYSLVIRTLGPGCGNGIVEGTEQCDDGNTMASDGCNATCNFEIAGTVSGIGMSQTFMGNLAAGQGAVYSIVLPSQGYLRAETFAPAMGQCVDVDTVLVLTSTSGDEVDGNDDGGIEMCSLIAPSEDALLEPGSYFLLVRGYSPTEPVGAFTLVVQTLGLGCGNTLLEMDEQCDDGNTMAGDGCNAMCRFEPSQTFAPPGGNASFNLAMDGDFRAFAVTIATAGQSITATVSSPGMGCGPATVVRMFDPAGAELGGDFGFGGDCSGIDFPGDVWATDLAPGTYLIAVDRVDSSTDAGSYRIDVGVINPRCGDGVLTSRTNEQCDDRNNMNGDGCNAMCRFEGNIRQETEPNDSEAQATASTAARNVTVTLTGAINPVGDVDYFSFVVPAGQMLNLEAQTYTQLGSVTTCNGIDTILELYDSTMTLLEDNDDSVPGSNFCSLINTAAPLMPGTYYVRVNEYSDDDVIPQYFLNLRLQ